MASNMQNKRLKMDVDNPLNGESSRSSNEMDVQSSKSDTSDTSDDYVFIDLSEDGNIKCRELEANYLCAGPSGSSQGTSRTPVVVGLTNDDSQPSTSSAGSDLTADSDNTSQLLEDVQWVCTEAKKSSPQLDIDPNLVFFMLENCGKKSNRRKQVLRELTVECLPRCSSLDTDTDIFDDVNAVMKAFPQADANIVYGLLESQVNQSKRVDSVNDILTAKFGNRLQKRQSYNMTADCEEATPFVLDEDDPFYDDVQSLAMIFPTKDEKLLHARLRLHENKPDRVQIVSKELMTMNDEELMVDSAVTVVEVPPEEPKPSTSGPTKEPLPTLHYDLELLSGFYPQCDPNHIFSRLEVHESKENRVEIVFRELEIDKEYPKRKDVEAKGKRQVQMKTWLDFFNRLPELVETFDDISEQFYNFNTKMSESYKRHLQAQVEYDFPWLKPAFLTSVCESYEFHLLPSYRYLQGLRKSDVSKKNRQKTGERGDFPNYPNQLDELYFKELMFVLNEDRLQREVREYKKDRNQRFEKAKSQGLLQECGCCYDDEVLLEDMLSCPEGHMFCRSCVRRSTEVIVGEARAKFPCLTGKCDTTFNLSVIQKAVSPKTYALVLRRIQEEELREAGIENLVTCPFCSFATIMENPDDKVFKCLNSECMKESCRLCQEESHIPLRCNEVEKKHEVDMRTYIEQKMTEAMLRTCHNCKKRFYKVEGCNKMTCVCGASMCYVCRKPIKDYSHFNNGKCNNENAIALHKKEVEEAFKKAQEEYFKEHPEAKDIVLKHDPRDLLEQMDGGVGVGGGGGGGGGEWAGPVPMPPVMFGRPEMADGIMGGFQAFARMFWVNQEEETDESDSD